MWTLSTEPEIANRLRADVEQMSRIVSQLLLVARLETVSINLDEIVDLNDAAAEIAGSLAPLALASGKSIELVRSDAPVVIRTNTFAVRAALSNLIENAIKHTPAGTSVRLQRHGSSFNRSYRPRRGCPTRATCKNLRTLLAGRQRWQRCWIGSGYCRSNNEGSRGIRLRRRRFWRRRAIFADFSADGSHIQINSNESAGR